MKQKNLLVTLGAALFVYGAWYGFRGADLAPSSKVTVVSGQSDETALQEVQVFLEKRGQTGQRMPE